MGLMRATAVLRMTIRYWMRNLGTGGVRPKPSERATSLLTCTTCASRRTSKRTESQLGMLSLAGTPLMANKQAINVLSHPFWLSVRLWKSCKPTTWLGMREHSAIEMSGTQLMMRGSRRRSRRREISCHSTVRIRCSRLCMMTKGLEGYSLWNEYSMSRTMRAILHLQETSEEGVVDTAMAISEVGTVEAVASEAVASEEIHVEASEVVASEEVTEVASEVDSEVATEVDSEAATVEDSEAVLEVAIEVASEEAGEDLIINRTEKETISSKAKTNDIIKI
jgi:hypothetical protein